MGAVLQLHPNSAFDGREQFRLFPDGGGHNRMWLYAIGYPDGRTKIGVTTRPRRRIASHWKQSGCALTWVHLFQACNRFSAFQRERTAVNMAAERAQRIGMTEQFRNLSRADALRCVREAIAAHLPTPATDMVAQ